MNEPPPTTPYPPIDPTTFDLIVVGTGLAESVIAAAASTAGKSVLHLDPNPFYGSHFSSLSLPDLTSFLNSNSSSATPSPSPSPPSADTTANSHSADYFAAVDLVACPRYSDVEVSSFAHPQLQLLEEQSRKFNLDVSGPRVLFCADKCIDLLLKSGASQYVEFKSIDASFVGGENGQLWSVPDSRAAIFKDKSLSLTEKKQLMRFFKLVQRHLAAATTSTSEASQDHDNQDVDNDDDDDDDQEKGNARISEEDLESPFVDFLTKMRLPPKIKSIILYAISLADYDQEVAGACQHILKTRDGIDRLSLYQSSVGRFANALGALIYPLYGQGELPQAFCRRAAVKGCIYVLRMPVVALLVEKDGECYKGVKLASGQDIFSQKLILDSSFGVLSTSASPSYPLHDSSLFFRMRDVQGKVARGICITGSSLKPDISNLLVVYPPRSLYPEQVTSIRALQIGSNLAVCPPGMFVFYLSTLCDDVDQGKKLLNAAVNTLFIYPDHANPESSFTVTSDDAGEIRPTLLWRAFYIQELKKDDFDSISFTSMPDGNLNYNESVDAAIKLFQKMYPDEEFFPETSSPENFEEDDSGLSLET